MHAGAIMGINLTPLSMWLKFALSIFVVIHAFISINKFVLLSNPQSIIGLSVTQQGQWHLMARNGDVLAAQLCGDSICSRWILILNFTLNDLKKKTSFLIFPDSIQPDHFRQLRAYLKILSRQM